MKINEQILEQLKIIIFIICFSIAFTICFKIYITEVEKTQRQEIELQMMKIQNGWQEI